MRAPLHLVPTASAFAEHIFRQQGTTQKVELCHHQGHFLPWRELMDREPHKRPDPKTSQVPGRRQRDRRFTSAL